ncbi:MAG: NAD-dependent epimerase/dehydratase family protein [Bacteroidales bacterium]
MKALVAGGAGFIGSHLIDALLKEGNDVVCIDNFFIGTRDNLQHLQDHERFSFYEQDLCHLDELSTIFAKEKFDYVFHLAANSDIQASAANPVVEYQNTYTTTFNLLECMRRHQVKKLFFASTSAVYGEKEGISLSEDTTQLEPISYYGAAKLGSEALISAFSYMNQFSTLVFRFPNVIGPRLTHGVIFDFIKKLKNNPTELQILGDGTQTKPYMHVSDLINGIMHFKDQPSENVVIYNIGVESQTNVTRIADIICNGMGLSNVKYNYTGGSRGWKGDVPFFAYDLSKIHKAGWYASMTSDEAVTRTVAEVLSCKQ